MRLLELAADIVAAHVGNNTVAIDEVGNLVRQVYQALSDVGGASGETVAEEKPAVSVRSSVKPDHLVCLVCGSHQKALRRHIGSAHGLAPDEYRARFNLPASYPMVAADYTERRREIARSIGLGRSRGPRPAPEAAPEAAPAKRGRGRPRS
jgi:predicted transcriptional regulator